MLDVIALHMENTKRCLDFCDSMPVDQAFRHHDPNLHHLKAVVVREVMHLTMILMLDKDIIVMHSGTYSRGTLFVRSVSPMVQMVSR